MQAQGLGGAGQAEAALQAFVQQVGQRAGVDAETAARVLRVAMGMLRGVMSAEHVAQLRSHLPAELHPFFEAGMATGGAGERAGWPSQAEGDEATIDESIREKEAQGQM